MPPHGSRRRFGRTPGRGFDSWQYALSGAAGALGSRVQCPQRELYEFGGMAGVWHAVFGINGDVTGPSFTMASPKYLVFVSQRGITLD